MSHRHLVLAYAVTWGIQLAYAAYLGLKWRAVRRAETGETPPSELP